jgi:GT2 family glycosyltransferase
MKPAVSIVIPALADFGLLSAALTSLQAVLAARGGVDEVLVVDDSGEGRIGPWLAEHFPRADCLSHQHNLGFARALSSGVHAARHELFFAMNSDVRVRAGFLEPLERCLAQPKVFAAVPRILLDGREQAIESLVEVRLEGGIARARQPALEETRLPRSAAARVPVSFPIGGAFLFRKTAFLELGGFDPAFEPFYLEDLDLGWRAWKRGLECWYVGDSVVEHHHRGTIGKCVPPRVVLTAIERNRLLFTWKHLDDPALLRAHLDELRTRIAEARLDEQRDFLLALCLALEDRARAEPEASPSTGPSWLRIQGAVRSPPGG